MGRVHAGACVATVQVSRQQAVPAKQAYDCAVNSCADPQSARDFVPESQTIPQFYCQIKQCRCLLLWAAANLLPTPTPCCCTTRMPVGEQNQCMQGAQLLGVGGMTACTMSSVGCALQGPRLRTQVHERCCCWNACKAPCRTYFVALSRAFAVGDSSCAQASHVSALIS